MRPLGISCYEDKLVENAISQLLVEVYEPKFYDTSYGFRPNRNCHQAIREVIHRVQHGKTNFVVEADIRGFFDNVDHDWLINWFDVIVQRQCRGECHLIRYADDFMCTFQYRYEAEVFRKRLEERLRKYGLELAEEKTRILEFGRFAESNRRERRQGKPETFDFLGFTFYCGMDSKKLFYRCKVKTCKKKFRSKVKMFKEWIKEHRTAPLEWIFKRVNAKLRGHYQYYVVTDNLRNAQLYRLCVGKLLYKWLNRRSQRRSYTWDEFNNRFLRTFPLVEPKTNVCLF